MASGIDRLAKQIAGMLKTDSPKGYDTTATVTRVEGGTAWVHIPGGVDETPVRLTINAKPGDNVQVRVSNGRAFLVGNGTAPPTDDVRANEAFNFAGLASGVAKKARAVADRAYKIAGNTAQYFWVTEEGTDTGAHITEKPQEEFLEDPDNGGANLLLRSIGIAIRQGLAELASFSLAGLHVSTYDSGGNEVTIAHLGYGSGKSQGSTNIAPYYSLGRRATGSDIGNYSIAEGVGCEASDYCSHAEGLNTIASGYLAHAEGNSSEATGNDSHAEGYNTKGVGIHTHAEGYKTTARGRYSHTEGLETSTGLGADASHAGGYGTKASSQYQTAIGKFNVEDINNQYAFIIGNGSSDNARSNAFTVDWYGNAAATAYNNISDIRLKKNIEDTDISALDAINAIRMRQFDWLSTNEHEAIGVIADELEKIDPAFTSGGGYNRDGSINAKTVNQTYLVNYLVKAVQELSAEVEELRRETNGNHSGA